MKFKKIAVIVLLIFFISKIGYSSEPSELGYGSSKILIESKSGRVLQGENVHQRLPMASTTKIMTALLAIEHGDLDEKVKIGRESVGIEGSSIYLQVGEEISLRDLVYGLMLRSGNDAAVAIANHISGSIDEFANLMNEKANDIGAKNSNFTNPNGLHDDNHYTTAYDLALITREAMKYEEFKKISSTRLWVADRDVNKYFHNKNKTLWQYEGGDGGKTGYTRAAGRCLVATATRNDMQLIAVVINNYDWFNECYRLFDFGFENYKPMVLFSENQHIKSIYVPNGKKSILPVVSKNNFVIPLKEDEVDKIKVVIKLPDEIEAPVLQNQNIGVIHVYLDGQLLFTDNLIAKENIKEKTNIDKLIDYLRKSRN